ncbi:MAG: MscL family protein [Anaeroplasma bactoclasticum]|nr:MscL family protein [Anaeroplasma bactoclasticum]MCM1557423.1 MscL family protein [Anaeroplasma bactoclasticum]
MKKLIQEFKAFILRGNVLDMAVGVIVGGAFNTIVTTLNKNILMPVVNWALSHIPGMSSGLYTILPNSKLADASTAADAVILGPNGQAYTVLNYIDWSAFIESILNFFFIALTLFIILKVFSTLSAKRRAFEESLKAKKAAEEQAKVEEVAEETTLEVVEETAPEVVEPVKDPVVILLEEIRDSLKEQKATPKKVPLKAKDKN